MRTLPILAGALALASLHPAFSQPDQSVNGLFTSVVALIRGHRPDPEVARLAGSIRLSDRLEDAVIEQLLAEGAGPETQEALERQRELSFHLAKAAPIHPDTAKAPPDAERLQAIDKARTIAIRYTTGLPDFVCSQTVTRYSAPLRTQVWKTLDVLKWDVGFSSQHEQYKLVSVNGQPATSDARARRGAVSQGEFGSLLAMIFKPETAAKFQWERAAILHGRAAHVFAYEIDLAHTEYLLNELRQKDRQIKVAVRGLVYIDQESGETVRVTTEALGIPSKFAIQESRSAVDYGAANIGGQSYFLPRRSDLAIVSGGILNRNVIEFGDYRKFATESTLTFDK